MTTFDNVTLKSWLDENSGFLTGARIQKIQQPTRRELIFVLRNNAETRKLYVNITPQFCHVCFMSKENEAKRLIEIPPKPPMFCMLLRKYLENARISKVNQPENERILELYTETYNELSEKVYLCLAIELMGKHSNAVLYNYDTNLIIGCAHNVGAGKSRVREMAGGLPYVYPPRKSRYTGANPLPAGNVNSRIDDGFASAIAQAKFKELAGRYTSQVNRSLKKLENSLAKMQTQTKTDAGEYRLFGDLIMANLHSCRDYSNSITVFDYENDRNITIELDPDKTLKDNANRFYKLYNKAKTANSKLFELIEKSNAEKAYLEQLLYSVETAQNIDDLLEISGEIEPERAKSGGEKRAFMPETITDEDYRIFIGRNNRQNDYIVSKLAKDDDLWFHARDCAGAHVLLKCSDPSDGIILQCARLAKENSRAAQSSKAGVIYTFAKYLKKPPKANLGYVTYKFEKEIVVE